MIDKDREIYSERLKKQYDELLSYRDLIQKEIDLKQRELSHVQNNLIDAIKSFERVVIEQERQKNNLIAENATFIDSLKTKEQSLIEKEAVLSEKEAILKQKVDENEEFSFQLSLLKKEIDNANTSNDQLRETLQQEAVSIREKIAELEKREGVILQKELQARKAEESLYRLTEVAKITESILLCEKEAVQKQKELNEQQLQDIQNQRIKLYSQQEALKLAVKEAKRRWQIQMPQ